MYMSRVSELSSNGMVRVAEEERVVDACAEVHPEALTLQ